MTNQDAYFGKDEADTQANVKTAPRAKTTPPAKCEHYDEILTEGIELGYTRAVEDTATDRELAYKRRSVTSAVRVFVGVVGFVAVISFVAAFYVALGLKMGFDS